MKGLFGFAILFGMVCAHMGVSSGSALCIRHLESLNYNVIAKIGRHQGDVSLEVAVNDVGKVVSVRSLSERNDPLLLKEASANVRQWTFEAGERHTFTVVYEFRLVEPELNYNSPTSMTVDFPGRVRIVSNFRAIIRD